MPGRLKIALYASWLWVDGQYLSPLARLDYLALFRRLRDRRALSVDGVEARTLELELDAASAGRSLQDVLDLVEDAGYERVELITRAGSLSLCTERCNAGSQLPVSSKARRTAVLLRRNVVSVWSGKAVLADATGADPELQRLLELPGGSADDFEAGLRGMCSAAARCTRLVVHFDEDLSGRELVRLLELLDRAAPSPPAAPPVISLSSSPPPPAGEEPSAFEFETPSTSSGRLPSLVIRQIVRASYGMFRRCYERGLAISPKLEGLVRVRFFIEEDGSVTRVANGGSDLPDEDVVSCVLHGFRSLHFPAPKAGIVTVEYPILLVKR